MPDVTLAGEVKDWLTSVAIVIGGAWAIWRFGHAEWLRRRTEKFPSLEGSSSAPEICALADGRVAVSLRWTWRNVGTRPVHIDDKSSFVEIFRLAGEIGNFVDPRQQETLVPLRISVHHPLKGYGFYILEPGTASSLLTVPILAVGEPFIARHMLFASSKEHPTGFAWQYSWERWQVFRTDLPPPAYSKRVFRP